MMRFSHEVLFEETALRRRLGRNAQTGYFRLCTGRIVAFFLTLKLRLLLTFSFKLWSSNKVKIGSHNLHTTDFVEQWQLCLLFHPHTET